MTLEQILEKLGLRDSCGRKEGPEACFGEHGIERSVSVEASGVAMSDVWDRH